MGLPDPEEIKPLMERLKSHILCNYTFYQNNNEGFHCDQYAKFKFYHLDPAYKYFQGFWWWYKKLKKLIEGLQKDNLLDSLKIAANSFFNIEYMPYHSKQYIDFTSILPSQRFNFGLVETALKENKIIIIMKGKEPWRKAIPKLHTYSKVYTLKSSQNSVISDKNLSHANGKKTGNEIFERLIETMQNSSKSE